MMRNTHTDEAGKRAYIEGFCEGYQDAVDDIDKVRMEEGWEGVARWLNDNRRPKED